MSIQCNSLHAYGMIVHLHIQLLSLIHHQVYLWLVIAINNDMSLQQSYSKVWYFTLIWRDIANSKLKFWKCSKMYFACVTIKGKSSPGWRSVKSEEHSIKFEVMMSSWTNSNQHHPGALDYSTWKPTIDLMIRHKTTFISKK